MSVSKALITGGAGFIGSRLVDALVARGTRVTIIDDLSTGKRENIAHHGNAIELIEASVTARDIVYNAAKGSDVIFHLAAVASVPKSIDDPIETHQTNTTGTLVVFDVAKELGIPRVVYASSSAVYGDLPGSPKSETDECCPTTPYGLHKMIGEAYAKLYHDLHDVSSVGLRFFNVYGPRQDASSPYSGVISLFAKSLSEGKQPTVYGDGAITRDFVYVGDAADALIGSAEADIACDVFNVGTGRETSINELLSAMNRALGTDIEAIYADPRPGDILKSCADISKAQKALGFEPKTKLEDGLKRVLVESR